jgi:hypothetical protein
LHVGKVFEVFGTILQSDNIVDVQSRRIVSGSKAIDVSRGMLYRKIGKGRSAAKLRMYCENMASRIEGDLPLYARGRAGGSMRSLIDLSFTALRPMPIRSFGSRHYLHASSQCDDR